MVITMSGISVNVVNPMSTGSVSADVRRGLVACALESTVLWCFNFTVFKSQYLLRMIPDLKVSINVGVRLSREMTLMLVIIPCSQACSIP